MRAFLRQVILPLYRSARPIFASPYSRSCLMSVRGQRWPDQVGPPRRSPAFFAHDSVTWSQKERVVMNDLSEGNSLSPGTEGFTLDRRSLLRGGAALGGFAALAAPFLGAAPGRRDRTSRPSVRTWS